MQDKFNPIASVPPIVAERLGRELLQALDRNNLALIDFPRALELINAGADITLQNQYQRTALHLAASAGNLEISTALVERGAPLNGKNNHGHTPLCVAVIYGHAAIAELLLKAGAIPDGGNNYGETPLARARYSHNTRIAAMLEQAMEEWRDQGLPLKSDVTVSKPLTLKR
ncbi:MAG: ankyrin repeat domain-containing protein [Alphaproteobacteria bacterium]|nr:MAG: ankyrin repeat domain-containing protein [Alphaproteobacteria bacterium]